MRDIVIDQKGCELSYERQLLLIKHDAFLKSISVPFSQIQSLTVTTHITLDSNLLTKMAQEGISINIIPTSHVGVACSIQGGWHAGVTRRVKQYELTKHDDACLHWAIILIKLKLYQQAKLLEKLFMKLNQQSLNHDIAQLYTRNISQITLISRRLHQLRVNDKKNDRNNDNNFDQANTNPLSIERLTLGSLLGIEGLGSSLFFSAYQLGFDSKLNFNNRNRRPPKDPVNVVLSLAYTLLQRINEQAVYRAGLDPYLGVLHQVSYGRASLACDFVELQRSEVEYWVWQLFDQGTLSTDDFSQSKDNKRPCQLLKEGRKKFYECFALIKPKLVKQAYSHVWNWQKRLEQWQINELKPSMNRNTDTDSNVAPEHISDHIKQLTTNTNANDVEVCHASE